MNSRTKLVIIGAVSSVVVCSPLAFCGNIVNVGVDDSFRGMILLAPVEIAVGAIIGMAGSYARSHVLWVVIGPSMGVLGGMIGEGYAWNAFHFTEPIGWAVIVIIGSVIGAIPLVIAEAFKHTTKIDRFEP